MAGQRGDATLDDDWRGTARPRRPACAVSLLASRSVVDAQSFGCDLMEVGRDAHNKKDRAGKNTILGNRIDMFDTAARNAAFLTATGVTDDHVGLDWAQPGDSALRYITSVWSASKARGDLIAALVSGRAW